MQTRVSGLESAKLKVARAAVHLGEINRLIWQATADTKTHEIVKDANGEDTIDFLTGPPRDVLVVVGEVVYQLRSALDHLAFELVESNAARVGLSLAKDWERDCHFPLMLKIPTGYGVP